MPGVLSGCCLQKARTRDPLRFLLDPCIDYPPFAKTRRFAAQTIARWRKLAQISLRKPGHVRVPSAGIVHFAHCQTFSPARIL